jgi:hypothetical protein
MAIVIRNLVPHNLNQGLFVAGAAGVAAALTMTDLASRMADAARFAICGAVHIAAQAEARLYSKITETIWPLPTSPVPASVPAAVIEKKPVTKEMAIGTGTTAECEQALADYPQDATIRKIATALGGKLCQLPILPWQDRFHEGGTGYIDGVQPKDLSHPMMRGVDFWSRPYIAIKTEDLIRGEKSTGAETLFQRYTDAPYIWTSGKHYLNGIPIVISTVDKHEIDDLQKLSNGETVDYSTDYASQTKKLSS